MCRLAFDALSSAIFCLIALILIDSSDTSLGNQLIQSTYDNPIITFSLFRRHSTDSGQLTGALTDNISLPCEFNVTGSDQVTLLLFYRNASHVGQVGAPLYTLDARTSGPAQHFVSGDLQSKIRLQWPPDQLPSSKHSIRRYSAALLIANLSLQDAGEYLCRVDFRWGRTLVNYIRLDVIGALKLFVTFVSQLQTHSNSHFRSPFISLSLSDSLLLTLDDQLSGACLFRRELR
jgi:hypothetical protein